MRRLDTENLGAQQKRCAAIISRFMELDIEQDDLVAFLRDYVIPTTEGVI